jgi:flavin reductase (DIM6/NTAB) family NADH-FMN oxidoreductase RutF
MDLSPSFPNPISYLCTNMYHSVLSQDLPTPKLHQLLMSAVVPRPICFASTLDAEGNPNLSPFSFFNIFGANPPLLIFSPARRGRDNTVKHTYENVKEVAEVVINVVNYAMVEQTSLASSDFPKGVNEFVKAGFTMLASDTVKPFRVAEAPVQMECKVLQVIETGPNGGAGNLVLCEVIKTHIKEELLNEKGLIDPFKLDPVSRLGGDWYGRAKEGLFELPKPLTFTGIGVDYFPKEVQHSFVLTGNDLGKLGSLETPPTEAEILHQKNQLSVGIGTHEVHQLAKNLIDHQQVPQAAALLLAYH